MLHLLIPLIDLFLDVAWQYCRFPILPGEFKECIGNRMLVGLKGSSENRAPVSLKKAGNGVLLCLMGPWEMGPL